eukprot:gene12867-biopygen12926
MRLALACFVVVPIAPHTHTPSSQAAQSRPVAKVLREGIWPASGTAPVVPLVCRKPPAPRPACCSALGRPCLLPSAGPALLAVQRWAGPACCPALGRPCLLFSVGHWNWETASTQLELGWPCRPALLAVGDLQVAVDRRDGLLRLRVVARADRLAVRVRGLRRHAPVLDHARKGD